MSKEELLMKGVMGMLKNVDPKVISDAAEKIASGEIDVSKFAAGINGEKSDGQPEKKE